jgi:hypothetical protein
MEGRGDMEGGVEMEMEMQILLGTPWMTMPCLNCRARRLGWVVRGLERRAVMLVMLVMFRIRTTVLMRASPAFPVGERFAKVPVGDGVGGLIQMYILIFLNVFLFMALESLHLRVAKDGN